MKYVVRRYDTNGAWTHDEEVVDNPPKENSMWKVHKIVGYEAVVTLKNFYSGAYNTRQYQFESRKDFDKWCDKHNNNHTLGKIIGIHKTIEYETEHTK